MSVFSLLVAYLSYKFKDRLFLFNKQNKTNVNKNIDNYDIKKSTSQKTTNDTKKVVVVNNNENMKPEFDNSQIGRMNEKIEDNKDEKNNESVENYTEKNIVLIENNNEKNNESIEKNSEHNEKSIEKNGQNKEINDNKYPDLDVDPPIINNIP